MIIIGCDFHTRYQQIAMLDEATGELTERRLDHPSGEAEAFYRNLQGPVRVGIEATGPIRWFERLLAELGHELWIGDAASLAPPPQQQNPPSGLHTSAQTLPAAHQPSPKYVVSRTPERERSQFLIYSPAIGNRRK
jgi:hypothetical protein